MMIFAFVTLDNLFAFFLGVLIAAAAVAAGFLFALLLDLRGVWDKLLRKLGIK